VGRGGAWRASCFHNMVRDIVNGGWAWGVGRGAWGVGRNL